MKQFVTDAIEKITDTLSSTYGTLFLLVVTLTIVGYGFYSGWTKEYADNVRLGVSVSAFILATLLLNDNHRTSEAQQARLLALTAKDHPELRDLENKPFEEAKEVKDQEAHNPF